MFPQFWGHASKEPFYYNIDEKFHNAVLLRLDTSILLFHEEFRHHNHHLITIKIELCEPNKLFADIF